MRTEKATCWALASLCTLMMVSFDNGGNKTNREKLSATLARYDEFDDFSEGLAEVIQDDKWGIIDKTGKEIAPCIYDDTGYFSEGFASVREDDKCGVIDKTGKEVIPCVLDNYRSNLTILLANEGLALCQYNGQAGYVDRDGYFIGRNGVEKLK